MFSIRVTLTLIVYLFCFIWIFTDLNENKSLTCSAISDFWTPLSSVKTMRYGVSLLCPWLCWRRSSQWNCPVSLVLKARNKCLWNEFRIKIKTRTRTRIRSSGSDSGSGSGSLVQVPDDLLQERVKAPVHLGLLHECDQLHVVRHQLAQVRHLLQDFSEQLQRVRMVGLQLQLQRVKNRLLEILDGLDVQQSGPI